MRLFYLTNDCLVRQIALNKPWLLIYIWNIWNLFHTFMNRYKRAFSLIPKGIKWQRHDGHVGVPNEKSFVHGIPTWWRWRHVKTLYRMFVACVFFTCRRIVLYAKSCRIHHSWSVYMDSFSDRSGKGAWVARLRNHNQWLQFDFGRPSKLVRIGTQGRSDAHQWVTKYYLSYSQDGVRFTEYQYRSARKVGFQNQIKWNILFLNTYF
jgi:hypothetical protein